MELESVSTRPGKLKQHNIRGERTYKCEKCHFSTTWPSYLKNHNRNHTGKKLKCEKCDYSTNWPQDLRNHNRKHSGEKYKCGKCDYSTCYRSHLKEHRRRHTGEQFRCEKCDFLTNWPSNLKHHSRIHTGKKYKCEKCNYSTTWSSDLKKHMRHIHNHSAQAKEGKEQQLQPQKGKETVTNMNPNKHNIKHGVADQKYCCHLCTFSADQSVNLEAHLLVRHAL